MRYREDKMQTMCGEDELQTAERTRCNKDNMQRGQDAEIMRCSKDNVRRNQYRMQRGQVANRREDEMQRR